MDNEPYRDLTHHEAADCIAAIIAEGNAKVWREHKLPSGKIADVFVQCGDGSIEIYEVKSEIKSSLLEGARAKYAHWCTRLYYAVPHLTYSSFERQTIKMSWPCGRDVIGVMSVYREALAIYRQPIDQIMHPDLAAALTRHLPKPWNVDLPAGSPRT